MSQADPTGHWQLAFAPLVHVLYTRDVISCVIRSKLLHAGQACRPWLLMGSKLHRRLSLTPGMGWLQNVRLPVKARGVNGYQLLLLQGAHMVFHLRACHSAVVQTSM